MVAADARLVGETRADDPRAHYRPQLDGLRAVAVYLVVAFHAGLTRFAGGFIGVDVFFVLSGFLVTRLLLRDVGTTGRIRFARFYSRRVRRLLPAAFVVLLVTTAAYAAVAAPAETLEALRSVKAAFLYVANWFFIRESHDYFGGNIDASPVLHFWSLSIEEQFYAVWPLLLAGLVLVAKPARRARWHVVRAVVAVAAACSLVAALRLADTDATRAYYGTDTRAYQLLVGALLALTPALFGFARRHRRALGAVAVAAVVALVGLATSLVSVGPITRGVLVTAVTAVLIVAIDGARDGVVVRTLATGPLVYLGQVSYGTYLWHWPVIVIAVRLIDPAPLPLFLLSAGLATGLASASYQLMERPVRVAKPLDRFRIPVIVIGVTASVVGAFVLAPALADDHRSPGAVAHASHAGGPAAGAGAVDPRTLDWKGALDDWETQPYCLRRRLENCVGVAGTGPRVLLMGDSNAVMLYPALEAMARRRGITLAVAARDSCPWQRGLFFADFRHQDVCATAQADAYERIVPEFDPDVVIVMDRTFEDPNSLAAIETAAGRVAPGARDFVPTVRRVTERSLDRLRRPGRRIVLVEPTPYAPKSLSPNVCLSGADTVEECRYVATAGPTGVERLYRTIAATRDDVWALDLDRLVCPYLPICDPVIEGRIVKVDQGHITATYSRALSDEIEQLLVDRSVLAARA